jgi:hypothetical protein
MGSQNNLRNLQSQQMLALEVSPLKNQRKLSLIAFIQIFDLPAHINSLRPLLALGFGDASQLLQNQIHKFLMRLNSCAADNQFIGTNIIELEPL